jgi:hypothetical protein
MSSLFNLTPKQQRYQRAYSLRFSSLFAAVVALAWVGIMSQYAPNNSLPPVLIILYIACFAVIAFWIYLFKKYQLPEKVKLPYMRSLKFWLLFYAIIIAEVVILYLLIQYFNSHHLSQAMWPLIISVVSLHWVPLGRLNGAYIWYYVAGFLVVGVTAIIIFISRHALIHILGISGNAWSILSTGLMIVTMLITSFVGLVQLVGSRYEK